VADMKYKSIEYGLAKYSVIEEVQHSIISAIASYFEKIQAEQAEAKRQQIKKRIMQSEYHQKMTGGLPLEEKLKFGSYRS
jgi:predicted ATP-binding protein involved in virulence